MVTNPNIYIGGTLIQAIDKTTAMENPVKKDDSKTSEDGKEDTPTPEEALKTQKSTYDGEHTMPLEELIQVIITTNRHHRHHV